MSKNTVSQMVRLWIGFMVVSSGFAASAQVSSTTSESSSTTSGSCKRLLTQNEQQRIEHFVAQNFDRLQEEAARGSGPILEDYARLLGCNSTDSSVRRAIQSNYQRLFEGGETQLLDQTTRLIEADPLLAQSCGAQS